MKEYGDNIVQLKLKKQHLLYLLEQKEVIMNKYISVTGRTPTLLKKEIYDNKKKTIVVKEGIDCNFSIKGKNKKQTPNDNYLIELEENDILINIEKTQNDIRILEQRIARMESPLRDIKGYEKKIYLKMLEGNNITQSVKIVSEECDKSERTMWRYANKLRKILNKHNIDCEIEIFL